MEKIIFFGLIIPILLFVVYLGSRAVMTGIKAKSSNQSDTGKDTNEKIDNIPKNSESLTEELNKLNELLKSGALTYEEFEKAKKKILDN